MAKRDTGMAGSSGYDSEFYSTDKTGKVQRNERTMKLQGMDPKKRIADSDAQVKRVTSRGMQGLPMSDRDKARMKAVGGVDVYGDQNYFEDELQNKIFKEDDERRQRAFDRGITTNMEIAQQKRQGEVKKQFGDNSFKPFTQNVPTLSKQIMAENSKKKR
jgi:hypothetical protein